MTSITTKGGDKGESSLFSGERKRKDDVLFEALGDLDELHVALAPLKNSNNLIINVMNISAMVATSPGTWMREDYVTEVTQDHAEYLLVEMEKLKEKTSIPSSLVTCNESATKGSLEAHQARVVCRRCERRLVTLIRDRERYDLQDAAVYLNRLADYLFVLAVRLSHGRKG